MLPAMGQAPATPAAYCRKCDYALTGLPEKHRCPECGQEFDLSNPKTFRRRPRRKWWRIARWFVYPLLLISLILGGCIGWCYWEWKREQPVIAWVEQQANDIVWFGEPPVIIRRIGPEWLQDRAGRWRWMLERADQVEVRNFSARSASQFPVSRLRRIAALFLAGSVGNDFMSEVGQLRELEALHIINTPLSDEGLSRLSGCRSMESLSLCGSRVGDKGLATLACPRLTELLLNDTPVDDRALPALKRQTKLAMLNLIGTKITREGLAELKKTLPNCRIVGPDGEEAQP